MAREKVKATEQLLEGPTSVPTITAPKRPAKEVQSRFVGRLSFQDGYPTSDTIEDLYDELDFQRATQVFLRNLSALSMYGFRLGIARDLGVDTATKLAVFRATANSLLLTPNSETLYGTTFLALDVDGPTVIEAPPGVLGFVNDMWMRPVKDIGPGGPDRGLGGKYLFVPPDYKGQVPESGYFVVPMQTFGGWVLMRAFLDPEGDDAPAHKLLKQTRIYSLAKKGSPHEMGYVEATGKVFDTTPPNDIRYFEQLADLIEREHKNAVDQDVAGMMQAIGIDKGKPFLPDERMKDILGEAARVGSFMAEAISFGALDEERVREGSQWLHGIAGYPTFSDGRSTLLDPLIKMSWFGTGAAWAMSKPKPGTGSQYVRTFKDASGQWLFGENNYRFRIPPDPPAKDFWSIVIYDNWTRAILPNGQKVASKNSYDKSLQANSDGSIDIYFGPNPPAGKESNWIRTVPGVGWFSIFRLYGPLEPWFDGTWTPDDIEQVK